MNKSFTIGWREYKAAVGTKAFVIALALMPVLAIGGVVLQGYLHDRVDLDDKQIVIFDHGGKLFQPLKAAADARNESEVFDEDSKTKRQPKYLLEQGHPQSLNDSKKLELSDQIRDGELFAFVVIEQGIFDLPTEDAPQVQPRIYSLTRIVNQPQRWLRTQINRIVQEARFSESNVEAALVEQITTPITFDERKPYTAETAAKTAAGEEEADKQNEMEAMLVPMGIMMLMVVSIFTTAQGLVQSVLEEKQLKIAEVLLGSANAGHIMAGKLIGTIGASLTMVLTYMAGAIGLAAYYDKLDLVSPQVIFWALLFQILAVMLYGAMFLAIGAACSNVNETQSLILPVILLAMFPMFVWFLVLPEPLGTFAVGISLIPTATPMLMTMRMAAVPSLPLWQPIVGVLLVIATTAFCVFVAGRVFRIGILARGKAPSAKELCRWVITG